MKKAEYKALVKAELARIEAIIEAKNNDYTSGSDSAFANFESTPSLASPFSGVLIRMGDKFKRLETYATKGSLQVANEGADDAARDIIGYALILLGMLADAKVKPKTRMTHVDEAVAQLAAAKPFKPEVGKRYVRRDGKLTGPLKKSPAGLNEHYPLWDPEGRFSYTVEGMFLKGRHDEDVDLVAEYK